MTLPNTLADKLTETKQAMIAIMDADSYSQTNRAIINSAFMAIATEKTYINSITSRVEQIMADKEFTMTDIPNVLIIMAQSQAALNVAITNTITLKTSLQADSMKYIVFGVLHFVLLMKDISTLELDITFSALWTLISINPTAIAVGAQSLFSGCSCCNGSAVKSSATEPTK